jgi:hypothetical protein
MAGARYGHDLSALQNEKMAKAAARQLAIGMRDWYRTDIRRAEIFGDLGQMLIIAAGFALQDDRGVTLARILHTVTRSGVASPGRVRAIIGNLQRLGIVTLSADRADGRTRPLHFGGWIEDALHDCLRMRISILQPWLPSAVADEPGLLARCLLRATRILIASSQAPDTWPEVHFFLRRKAGYPILLELICGRDAIFEDERSVAISRKWLGKTYRVSRPHVVGLVRECMSRDWIEDTAQAYPVVFTSGSSNRIRSWLIYEVEWARKRLS